VASVSGIPESAISESPWTAPKSGEKGPDYAAPISSSALRPGDIFTKRYSIWAADEKQSRKGLSSLQKTTILIGILCIVLSVLLFWIFMGDIFGGTPQENEGADEQNIPPIAHTSL